MTRLVFSAKCLDDTERLGSALASCLPNGTTVSLCGTLGAGKTRLVQSIVAASGMAREEVVSPTFVLCQEYHAQRVIYHLDAYRLQDDDEFLELGPEEYFDSDGLTFIEWGDRVVDCLPPSRLEIQIDITGETSRDFTISGLGDGPWDGLMATLARLIGCAS